MTSLWANQKEVVVVVEDEEQAERGAGGKLRRPPPARRRSHTTPYSRPQPQNQPAFQHRPRGWLSKIVDPAYRLISGGATLFLPSFFSSSSSSSKPECDSADDHDESNAAAEQNTVHGGGDDVRGGDFASNQAVSTSTEVAGTSRVADGLESATDFNGCEKQHEVDLADHDRVSAIEQLIKGKRFSRDEINRLIEMINSRSVRVPDADQESKHSSLIAENVGEPPSGLERLGKSSEGKEKDLNRSNWGNSFSQERRYSSLIGGDFGGSSVLLENSKKLTEERHCDLNTSTWGAATPLTANRMHDDIGSSPVEIARAFMEGRTSELGPGSKSLTSRDEMTFEDEHGSKLVFPLTCPKPTTCWPGALVQDQRAYMTPQSQRGRFGLNQFSRTPYSRTPYSRTLYSKSKSKLLGQTDTRGNNTSMSFQQSQTPIRTQLLGETDACANLAATSFQRSQSPTYGQVNQGNGLDHGHGSVGPIRRIRNKAGGNPRGSPFFQYSNSAKVEKFNVSEGLTSSVKNFQGGASSSSTSLIIGNNSQSFEGSVVTVPAHSSQTARKILEHLQRNPQGPKDKSSELKLTPSWEKHPSSNISTTPIMGSMCKSLPLFGIIDSSEKPDQVQKNSSVRAGHDRVNSLFKVPQVGNYAVKHNTPASKLTFGHTNPSPGGTIGNSLDFMKSQDAQVMNSHEDASKSMASANSAGSEMTSSVSKNTSSDKLGTRLVLPYISIGKNEEKWALSSDNSSGFTFPVSASSGVLSEPPTPSILPSSSASGPHQADNGVSVPSFSFGAKKSTAIIFSFPSTSSASVHDDGSELKFNFGSDKSTRIAFSSVGKDAICY